MSVEYREFKIGEVFNIKSPSKRFNANAVKILERRTPDAHPYVVRKSTENGWRGYIEQDEVYLSPARTLSFGQDTATVFYQPEPYFTGDKIKVLSLKDDSVELTEEIACYLITLIRKAFSTYSWGTSSFNEKELLANKIVLPVNSEGIPDYNFMAACIKELELEYVKKAEEYLQVIGGGVSDCELTSYDNNAIACLPFRIASLFEKQDLRILKKDFDKRKDTSPYRTPEFSLPVVNAKLGDNGVMFWGRPEDFESAEMCIDVIQNGAVATGTVYAQPQRTGVLWDAYLIKPFYQGTDSSILIYLAAMLEKVIKRKYSYDKKATWSRVMEEEVFLPVTDSGQPDYSYMRWCIQKLEYERIKSARDYLQSIKMRTCA